MNARELLQMNEQMTAFNTIMSGALKDEMKKAKAALDALGTAEQHAEMQAKLDAAKASFEAYKDSIQTIFDETKDDLALEKEKIKQDKATLAEKAKQLTEKQREDKDKENQVAAEQTISKTNLDQAWSVFSKANAEYADKQATLVEKLEAIAAREAMVQAKLDAIAAAAA